MLVELVCELDRTSASSYKCYDNHPDPGPHHCDGCLNKQQHIVLSAKATWEVIPVRFFGSYQSTEYYTRVSHWPSLVLFYYLLDIKSLDIFLYSWVIQ